MTSMRFWRHRWLIAREDGVCRWSGAADPGPFFADEMEQAIRRFYIREPDGELLASFEEGGANRRYCHFDQLGSTVLMTSGGGSVLDSLTYGAWGDVLYAQSDLVPYQFVGQLGYYSHTSGQGTALSSLLELGVRFYDPEVGRFTQRDPWRDGISLLSVRLGTRNRRDRSLWIGDGRCS